MIKMYRKVKDHCHYTGKYRDDGYSKCNLKQTAPKTLQQFIDYNDYYFIIKKLAKDFEREFSCLGENKLKYITFSVPVKK